MRDTHRPVRKAFYDLLNNQLMIEQTVIPVSSVQTKSLDDNNNYVILDNQSSTPDDTKNSNDELVTITVDIVTKSNSSVSTEIADSIADQIFTLLFSSPHAHNLPIQPGFQFLNVSKSNDNHLSLQLTPTQHMHRRILQFSVRVAY